jgi:hypothetical protein
MAVTFSRKPAYSAAAPADGREPGDLRARILAAAANPFIGASAAAFLFLLSLALLVLVTGDPNKGSPLVRVALDKIGTTRNVPEGWREALVPRASARRRCCPAPWTCRTCRSWAIRRPRPRPSPPRPRSPSPPVPWRPPRSPASTRPVPAAASCR